MKVISILNEKGGVGKTQTAINLAVGCAREGYKVLIIDFDPQANASNYFNIENQDETLETMLMDSSRAKTYKTQYNNLDIIPTTKSLSLSSIQIAELKNRSQIGRLKEILDSIPNYDLIIIDLLPTLNILTTNALYVSDVVVSPTTIDTEGFSGLFSTRDNIIELSNDYDLDIDHYTLFNKVQLRSKIDLGLMNDLKNNGFNAFNHVVRYQNAPMKKASLKLLPVINSFAKTNKVGNDYRLLIEEIIERFLVRK